MGGLLRGGRRGFGSGGRAFNGAAILTRHLVAFSTRQWRRCRLGSRPPSAGRGAHCLADRTGLPGKGRKLRREQGALRRGRALSLASGGRARAAAARETWPLRAGPAPARSSCRALPMASRGDVWTRALWTARGPPEASRRTDSAAPARDPLAGLPPAIFRASRRAGKESAPSSSAEAPPRRGPRSAPAPRLPAAHTRRYRGEACPGTAEPCSLPA